jgi:5-methylcytosine-specific restriction endonuclease McrA
MARFPQVYRTAEWERSREFVIQRAQGLCEECLRQGRVEAGIDVDHIIPLNDQNWRDWNIAYNPDNLQLLCKPCHAAKHSSDSGLSRFVEPVPANSNGSA